MCSNVMPLSGAICSIMHLSFASLALGTKTIVGTMTSLVAWKLTNSELMSINFPIGQGIFDVESPRIPGPLTIKNSE